MLIIRPAQGSVNARGQLAHETGKTDDVGRIGCAIASVIAASNAARSPCNGR